MRNVCSPSEADNKSCLLCSLLLSLALHGFLFLLPAREMARGSLGASHPSKTTVLQVQLRLASAQSAPISISDSISPTIRPSVLQPEATVDTQGVEGLIPVSIPVPSSKLSFHPVLLNGEVLEEGARMFPPDLAVRVVVEVLINHEGRVERVWQQGDLNPFSLWLGEVLMTQIRFRPAELDGELVSTVLRLEFNLAADMPVAPEAYGTSNQETNKLNHNNFSSPPHLP